MTGCEERILVFKFILGMLPNWVISQHLIDCSSAFLSLSYSISDLIKPQYIWNTISHCSWLVDLLACFAYSSLCINPFLPPKWESATYGMSVLSRYLQCLYVLTLSSDCLWILCLPTTHRACNARWFWLPQTAQISRRNWRKVSHSQYSSDSSCSPEVDL